VILLLARDCAHSGNVGILDAGSIVAVFTRGVSSVALILGLCLICDVYSSSQDFWPLVDGFSIHKKTGRIIRLHLHLVGNCILLTYQCSQHEKYLSCAVWARCV